MARRSGPPTGAWRSAPATGPDPCRSGGSRSGAGARSRGPGPRPRRRPAGRALWRMLREIPRRRWNSSNRVTPRKASRTMSMLHHSPTTSRHWATEQSMSAKLLRSMQPGSGLHYETQCARVSCMTELDCSMAGTEGTALAAARTRRFVVTALGAFMASLDLSIVNVAFPALERSFSHDPGPSLAWVITGYSIVFGSLLVVAGRTADRLGAGRSSSSVWRSSVRARRCAGWRRRCPAGGRSPGPGRGRRGPAAVLARPAAGRLPARAPLPDGGPVGGHRGAGRGHGTVAGCRPISAGRLAVGVLVNLPIGLAAWLVGRRCSRRSTRATPACVPDYPGVVLVTRGAGRPGARRLRRPDLGLVEPPVVVASARAVVLGARLPATARPATPSRCWT